MERAAFSQLEPTRRTWVYRRNNPTATEHKELLTSELFPGWTLNLSEVLASISHQLAPLPVRTLGVVSNKIFQSNPSDQLSMYCMSMRIQVSKSSLSRPARAQRQVNPGRMRSRRRCHCMYCSTSSGTAGRGPTSDMSPRRMFHSCGHSSMENLRR